MKWLVLIIGLTVLFTFSNCKREGLCTVGCNDNNGVVIYDTNTHENYTEDECELKAKNRETSSKTCWYDWEPY